MILGQAAPAAATPTVLYEVPRGVAYAWLSALIACNRGGVADAFRISIGPVGGGLEQYIFYDIPIAANDTMMLDPGADGKSAIRLSPFDRVVVYAGGASMSFSLIGETA